MYPISHSQFQNSLEKFIQQNPTDLDKIQQFIQENEALISRDDAMGYLHQLNERLIKEGQSDHPIINTINKIREKLLKTTVKDIPQEVIFLIFNELDVKEWAAISLTDALFHRLSLSNQVIAILLKKLEDKKIPLEKKIELAKIASHYVEKLDLSGTDVTDRQINEIIDACPYIQELNLSGCNQLINPPIDKLLDLKILEISSCQNLSKEILNKIPPNCQVLNLSIYKKLSDDDLGKLPKNLKALDLTLCHSLSGQKFDTLPRGLQVLILPYNTIGDDTIKDLPRSIKNLDLTDSDITDEGISHLPPNIEILNLSNCENLTDAALKKLPKSLQILNLSGCHSISENAIAELPSSIKVIREILAIE